MSTAATIIFIGLLIVPWIDSACRYLAGEQRKTRRPPPQVIALYAICWLMALAFAVGYIIGRLA